MSKTGYMAFNRGLPSFLDCNISSCPSHPQYLHCEQCEGTRFYGLQQMSGIGYNVSYQAVYLCIACCAFHTVDKNLRYREGKDDIQAVVPGSWKMVELITR